MTNVWQQMRRVLRVAVVAAFVGALGLLVATSASAAPAKYLLQFPHSGKCVDVSGGRPTESLPLDQWTCVPTARNEQWQFWPVPGRPYVYQIKNVATRKCMNIQQAAHFDGARVIQYTCVNKLNEYFKLKDSGRRAPYTYYLIQNVNSGKCIHVHGASRANNALITQWGCNAGFNHMQIRLWHVG